MNADINSIRSLATPVRDKEVLDLARQLFVKNLYFIPEDGVPQFMIDCLDAADDFVKVCDQWRDTRTTATNVPEEI